MVIDKVNDTGIMAIAKYCDWAVVVEDVPGSGLAVYYYGTNKEDAKKMLQGALDRWT